MQYIIDQMVCYVDTKQARHIQHIDDLEQYCSTSIVNTAVFH